jgi:hypothetical protein
MLKILPRTTIDGSGQRPGDGFANSGVIGLYSEAAQQSSQRLDHLLKDIVFGISGRSQIRNQVQDLVLSQRVE